MSNFLIVILIKDDVDLLKTVRVNSNSVKRFTLETKFILDECDVVEIDCPRLEYMRMSDCLPRSFIIYSIDHSVMVDIDVDNDIRLYSGDYSTRVIIC